MAEKGGAESCLKIDSEIDSEVDSKMEASEKNPSPLRSLEGLHFGSRRVAMALTSENLGAKMAKMIETLRSILFGGLSDFSGFFCPSVD